MSRVERFNPLKASTLSRKRDHDRAGRRGEAVPISEITFEEVKRDAVRFGLATEVWSQMNAGKEASIFLAHWREHPIILKAYRLWQTSQADKHKGFYALGKMESLAAKEYDVLSACFKATVHVPTPIGRVGNYLTMRFLGDSSDPAQQLKDVRLDDPEQAMEQVFDEYLIMYRDAKYVHGDLSAYNILWWRNHPWIIDVPQAYFVGPWADMKVVVHLLKRDIINVLSYFKRYGVQGDPDHILKGFLSEYVPNNLRNSRELLGVWASE
jgi:RIO kinase 1